MTTKMFHSELCDYRSVYEHDGVVLVKDVFSKEQLDLLAIGIEKCASNPTKRHVDYVNDGNGGQRFFYDAVMFSEIEELGAAIRSSSLPEIVANTMASCIATAFYVSIFRRTGGEAKRTPWHQDQPFWPADGQQCCSTWIPLDPISRSTALEFVRSSHKWDVFGRPDFSDSPRENYLSGEVNRIKPFPDIESKREKYDIIGWDVNPGDCLLFHGMTAHGGSGGLLPSNGRRAISVQWLGDDAIYMPKVGGHDPDFTKELEETGLIPGDRITSHLCPVLWRNTISS